MTYGDRYRTPLGYLLVTWTVVYFSVAAYVVYVAGRSFDTALLLGSGLVFSLLVAFVLDRRQRDREQ
jgi:hypothetical protein